jgi:hypothetical protein
MEMYDNSIFIFKLYFTDKEHDNGFIRTKFLIVFQFTKVNLHKHIIR